MEKINVTKLSQNMLFLLLCGMQNYTQSVMKLVHFTWILNLTSLEFASSYSLPL